MVYIRLNRMLGPRARQAIRNVSRQTRRDFSMKALRRFELEKMPEWYACQHQMSSSESAPLSLKETLSFADSECLEAWESLTLGYPSHSKGSPVLIAEIQKLYSEPGMQATCCAPSEGILLALQALLSPNDHVVAMSPCYASLTEVARAIGCEIDFWKPRFVNGRFVFDVEEALRMIHPGTAAIILNLPHNPTGANLSAADFKRICDLADATGPRIFCDEMYRGLEHDSAHVPLTGCWPGPLALPSAVEMSSRAVALGGMSKVFGMPGIRMGWLATRDLEVMHRIDELKDYTTMCPATPSEVLALIGLRARSEVLLRSRQMVRAGLRAVRAFVALREEDFEWSEVQGGTMMLLRLRSGCASRYCKYLAQHAGVMLVPASKFGGDDVGLGGDFFRVGYGGHSHLLHRGLETWAEHHARALQAAHGVNDIDTL